MDKELQENYSLDFTQQTQILRQGEGSTENSVEMVDYMLSNHPPPQHQLSFADVMQFADFGPKLVLNQGNKTPIGEDDSYFFKLNFMTADNKIQEGPSSLPPPPPLPQPQPPPPQGLDDGEEEEGGQFSENASSMQPQQQQLGFGGVGGDQGEKIGGGGGGEVRNRRKRPRSMKTSEEAESQRMTHIAVERNRRRQMNEHLRVLRSLMPGSYVQRGDQASIIGGAIEFARELEQLLQCLESQKRRRLFGGNEPPPRNMADSSPLPAAIQQSPQQPFFPPLPLPLPCGGYNMAESLHEDMAENKSCLADIEVRVSGFDAVIKILSRRRPGQLIKTIAALEDLQFNILHTNVTTIEQTVLYSFNVKIAGEASCAAEDIANSVQQILGFIDTSTI